MAETLYEITQDYQMLMEMADDEDCNEEAFAEALESISDAIEDKADAYAKVIANLKVVCGGLDGQIEAVGKELERIKARKQSIENKIDRMKESLCTAMIATNKTKFKTEQFSFSVRKTPGKVVIDGVVPMDFLKVPEPQPDKTAIKKAIDGGQTFDWAHLESRDIAQIR